MLGPGLGASPPPWRVRAAGPGTRRHTPAPAEPRPRAACRAKPPPRRGDPASLPPRGGQLEERAVAGGSRGFHEPEESLCRLLRRAPPRTRSCPGSSRHLAACSGQRCGGRGGPAPSPPRAPTRWDLAFAPWPNPVSTSRGEDKPLSPRLRRLLLPLAGYFQARSPPHRGILLSISHYGFKVH